jgi:hypothetical protein
MKVRILVVLACAFLFGAVAGPAQEIGYLEKFSLADDRSGTLKDLIPGTEEYYYYHCLHYLNTGQLAKVEEILPLWIKRYDHTPLVEEILNRQALLSYDADSKKSIAFLTERLGLKFDHRAVIADENPGYPTSLDPKEISYEALYKLATARFDNLDGFESHALEEVAQRELDALRLHNLLSRLERPDLPNLPKLVAKDLENPQSGAFGSLPIHQRMLRNQLDELLRLRPDLGNNEEFVKATIARIRPGVDAEWKRDPEARIEYCNRLWEYVQKLAPTFNSLKANVLYEKLVLDRSRGVYDKDRFLEYIKLPRPASYMNPKYLETYERLRHQANLSADYRSWMDLSPIGNDEALVRNYLLHLLVQEDSYTPYTEYIRDTMLKQLFAEAKLVNGIGDAEPLYSLLAPDQIQALKSRVDLDFAFTNHEVFAPDEVPRLDLFIKNVKKLIVRVFEINTLNYYRDQQRPVDIKINLDGLVPNNEREEQFGEIALRRVLRSFEFPQIKKRGVYIVEFIGNGRISRALIRKGELRLLERISTAGHVFRVLDELNRKVEKAELYLAGHIYKSDSEGEIVVPFTRNPGRQALVVRQGDFAWLDHFNHRTENYSLAAGFYVDREALLRRKKATVLVRPSLQIQGTPVTLSVLEDVRLSITWADRDGVTTTREIPDFRLFEDRESTHEFLTPENLSAVTFTLKARVQNLSMDKKQDLESSAAFSLNDIDRTAKTEDLHLLAGDGLWFLDLLGKTGEAMPDRPVTIDLKHRDFREPVHIILQTNASGRIQLGALTDIEWIRAQGPEETSHTWSLPQDFHNYPAVIHARVGDSIRVPYMGKPGAPLQRQASLMESQSGVFIRDCIDAVQIRNGFLEISNLTAGDYDLLLKETGNRITLRLTGGEVREGWALSSYRQLEVRNPNQLQITAVDVGNDAISIRLTNATKFTRIHIAATRFSPLYAMAKFLRQPPAEAPHLLISPKPYSEYEAGREMGSEQRYILDRKYAAKFPGNMLTRPELLLNPWAMQTTEGVVSGRGYGIGGGMGGGVGRGSGGLNSSVSTGTVLSDSLGSNLDFLSDSSVVLTNLRPDGEVLRIDRKSLGNHQHIHILAVDPENTVYRSISLPETPPAYRDLRLAHGLDPSKHFAERDKISIIEKNAAFTLADTSSAAMESYDSIGSVYRLYAGLSNNKTLSEFGFILDWLKMKLDEKRKKYSEFACHELNVWLYHKDRAFFDQVIKPSLMNKKNKTFLDRWFLEEDLSAYLKPWEFAQLNVVEQILLGQRIASERDRIARHVRDRYDLVQLNTELLPKAVPMGMIIDESDKKDALISAPSKEEPSEDEPKPSASFYKQEKEKRQVSRALYRPVDKTEEFAENNYYRLPIEQMDGNLIAANAFWRDYAQHDGKSAFLSINLAEAVRNFTEMMFALSVLDLPIESGKHETSADGTQIMLKPSYPILVHHKQIREVEPASEKSPVQVIQNFFRPDDRYRNVGNERVDKYISDEFLRYVVYGCQVIVMNPALSKQKLGLLLQIPEGAIPVQNGFVMQNMQIQLEPHATQTVEYFFYFPKAGRFSHYPAQVSKDEGFIAAAPAATIEVVDRATRIDKSSWNYLSQQGAPEEVLKHLQENNVNRLALDKIAWRMSDRGFFENVIGLLRKRYVYSDILWSYGLYHNNRQAIREYLQHREDFLTQCGEYIDTSLIVIDPIDRKTYRHLEYGPLIHARVHRSDETFRITNDRIRQQYRMFLKVLSYRPKLNDEDFMESAYYLLLQDRVEEALTVFSKVKRERLATQMQYDYMQAYLAFSQGQPSVACGLAKRYQDYPLDRWRGIFAEVSNQCDEIEGRVPRALGAQGRAQTQSLLAGTEPSLDLKVESKKIQLVGQNVKDCTLNFYRMDTELLFSRNPFVRDFASQFSYARQNRTMTVELPQDHKPLILSMPNDLQNENLMIEAVAGGVRSSAAYTANRLDAQVIENYGQVQVAEEGSGRRLAKVYVKVYARMSGGAVVFYKDGYTDLRGRFDYASLTTAEPGRVERFAILIISDTHGAVIREVAPPKR